MLILNARQLSERKRNTCGIIVFPLCYPNVLNYRLLSFRKITLHLGCLVSQPITIRMKGMKQKGIRALNGWCVQTEEYLYHRHSAPHTINKNRFKGKCQLWCVKVIGD